MQNVVIIHGVELNTVVYYLLLNFNLMSHIHKEYILHLRLGSLECFAFAENCFY